MKRQRWRVSDPVLAVVLTVLLGSPHFPYWKGGLGALAAECGALSRRQIRRALILLAGEGVIIYKSDKRGRGVGVFIRVRPKRVDKRLVGTPPTPPSIRECKDLKTSGQVNNPRRLLGRPPEAYTWKGKLMRWLRTEVRHPIVTRLIGHWVFHRDLPKEWARALYYMLERPENKRFLFEQEFRDPRQAWGWFVWLFRWAIQRWLMTGRTQDLEDVWRYACDVGRPADVRV